MSEYITLGGHRVEVRRHATARHLRLSVDPRLGGIRLTVPRREALSAALRWAQGQVDWVARHAATPEYQPIMPNMAIPLGDLQLTLCWDAQHPRLPKRHDDQLLVGGQQTELAARVLRWLKSEALRQLTVDTHEIAARAGLQFGRVGVGDPRSRWGSCSAKGDIRYSWRLIMAPANVRRATVAHEVAHLAHMNHGPDFHRLVERLHDGDVTAARNWLKTQGTALHQFGRSV